MKVKQVLVIIKDIAMKCQLLHRQGIFPPEKFQIQLMVPMKLTMTEVRAWRPAGCEVIVTRGTTSWHGWAEHFVGPRRGRVGTPPTIQAVDMYRKLPIRLVTSLFVINYTSPFIVFLLRTGVDIIGLAGCIFDGYLSIIFIYFYTNPLPFFYILRLMHKS
jgi:hypothetical protein